MMMQNVPPPFWALWCTAVVVAAVLTGHMAAGARPVSYAFPSQPVTMSAPAMAPGQSSSWSASLHAEGTEDDTASTGDHGGSSANSDANSKPPCSNSCGCCSERERERELHVTASAASEHFAVATLAHVTLSVSVERTVPRALLNESHAEAESVERELRKCAVDAYAETARRANDLVALLRSANAQKLRTTRATVEQIFDYPSNAPARQIGVRVREGLSFRTNISAVGALLTSLVDAGVTRVDGMSFVTSEDDLERVTLAAERDAIAKAQRRAATALQAAGCTGTVTPTALSVTAPDGGTSATLERLEMPMAARAMASFGGGGAAPLPVIGGENSVLVHATVTAKCARAAT